MDIERFGEQGIRVIFGQAIDEATHELVRRFFLYTSSIGIPGIVEIIPSFRSCLICFDRERVRFEGLSDMLKGMEDGWRGMPLPDVRRVEIPVRYGGDYGPDMDFVCSYSGLSPEEVVEIHSRATYRVHALGFMPGFPHLGPLDRKIYVPRQETPVLKVPQGSVGIAQLQTGIYPFESPAGWRVIGRTMVRLFDHLNPPFSLLNFGDIVRFVRI
ncbi:MAG: Kinase A inhibitor [Syntrophorhabdus sp. PtaB.Bin047]|nr:MAG: Kinase A inhibitor [Syntrophorhabdus sp. PtaB.Bin047]